MKEVYIILALIAVIAVIKVISSIRKRIRLDLYIEECKKDLSIEKYDDTRFIVHRFGGLLVTQKQLEALCKSIKANERFKLSIKEEDGKFYPLMRFGSFSEYEKITVLRAGDLDDSEVTPSYDTYEKAKRYCMHVLKENAFANTAIQILECTNKGDLFGEDE